MNTQKCIMCGEVKPLSDFYKHPMMANGHLGRCKVCHRSEARRIRNENVERCRAYDRDRNKLPGRKAQYAIKDRKKRKKEGPIYDRAHNALARAVATGKVIRPDHCQRCLVQCAPQAHHDDYSRSLEVMFLCPICHAQRHKELGRLRIVDAPVPTAPQTVAPGNESASKVKTP